MHTVGRTSTVVLDRYQDFKAVTLGAESPDAHLPEDIEAKIDYSLDNWRFPTSSVLEQGLIRDYIGRRFPHIYIDKNELPPVIEACSETLATRGLKGAYYKIRGFKKAARRIIGAADSFESTD